MASDKKTNGVWKSGKGKGRKTPKGRQVTEEALLDIKILLGDRERRADLLINFFIWFKMSLITYLLSI